MVKKSKKEIISVDDDLSSCSSEIQAKPAKKTKEAKKKSAKKSVEEPEVEIIKSSKKNKKPAAKKDFSDDSDSSDEADYLSKKKARKGSKASKTSKGSRKGSKASKKVESSDSDSEPVKPKKSLKSKKKVESSDSESEEPVKPKKAKKAPKKVESSDSESDEPVKPKKKTPKKVESSDSESDEPVVKETKKVSKKADSDEESDDSESQKKDSSEEKPEQKAPVTPQTQTNGGEANPELFLKGLSYRATEESIKEYMEFFGKITKVRLIKDRETGRSRGIAFVEFESAESAQKAANFNEPLEIDGRAFQAEISKGGASKGPGGNRPGMESYTPESYDGPKFTLFCGNLGFKTTYSSIENFFSPAKPVDIRIALQEDGRRKGFAHIDFRSEEDRASALSKNGQELDGRGLRLDESSSRGSGPGGNRGGPRRAPVSDFDRAKKSGQVLSVASKAQKIEDSDSD